MNRDEFLALALRNPVNVAIMDELDRLALPDAWLVSGCLVQTVWNVLTGLAVSHGIARALLEFDVNLRPSLKSEGLLTRDSRMKERKKYGQPGARKRFQFSKR